MKSVSLCLAIFFHLRLVIVSLVIASELAIIGILIVIVSIVSLVVGKTIIA